MNRSDVIGGSAVPLTEALPWVSSSLDPRVFLVSDAIDTDGRFLLYTLASQVLSSSSSNNNKKGRVLWLGCGPITEDQIIQGLRKIGCDRSVLVPQQTTSMDQFTADTDKNRLTIRSLCVELSNRMLSEDNEEDTCSEAQYLAETLQFVEEWLQVEDCSQQPHWIILDDASTFASLVGEQLLYQFILQLTAKSHASNNGNNGPGLMIRCSNDTEQESSPVYSGAAMQQGYQAWFGAGGGHGNSSNINHQHQSGETNDHDGPPWERALLDLADGVMDVLPLASGYTRELHGRIVLTETPFGRGWRNTQPAAHTTGTTGVVRNKTQCKPYRAMQIINYCITDQNPKIVAYIM